MIGQVLIGLPFPDPEWSKDWLRGRLTEGC